MIEGFTTWAQNALQSQIFGGVAAASALAYAGFALRSIPGRVSATSSWFLTRQFQVRSDDRLFYVMATWLAQQDTLVDPRRLRLVTPNESSPRYARPMACDDDDEAAIRWELIPGAGANAFRYRGQMIHFEVSDGSNDPKVSPSGHSLIIETITFTVPFWSTNTFRDMVADAVAGQAVDRRIKVFRNKSDYFIGPQRKEPRALESVVTAANIGPAMVADAREFLASNEWYVKRGIPWRRGYLLEGPPGTGKSSLAFALACALEMPIYSIQLSIVANDGDLLDLIARAQNGIVLLEDIDAAGVSETRAAGKDADPAKAGVTLSGLLNAIDGVAAVDGRILVMTTNHSEKLDPALTRAGRIDLRFHMGWFGAPEIARMWEIFFDTPGDVFAHRVGATVQPAELQEYLMVRADDLTAALRDADQLRRARAEAA